MSGGLNVNRGSSGRGMLDDSVSVIVRKCGTSHAGSEAEHYAHVP